MHANRFATVAILLTGLGLGGVALGDALTSPDNQVIDPSFDIRSVEVRAGTDVVRFRMTLRGEAGVRRPGPTGQLGGSQMFAYLWPTSADSAVGGFPHGRGLLVLGLVSHPDLVETVGNQQLSGGWHPHWFVAAPGKGCGPFGLRIEEGPPASPGALPVLTTVPNFPATLSGTTVEVQVPRRLFADPALLRYDGITATMLVSSDLTPPVLCVRVMDVASGRLSLTGTVTVEGR
ncbi:hypothetical protein [Pedomonas sp. V897]|uniref:hypothetical protein n=1 Tax=Pedomonas sp. V897 TaxID=3446482 RepID=UPI003EE02DFB